MTDTSNEPIGTIDAGEPLYVIVDDNGVGLSHHRTEDGAKKILPHTPGAVGIQQTTLFY